MMLTEEVEFLIINTHRQTKAQRVTTGDWLGVHYLSAFLNSNGIKALSFAGYAHEIPGLLDNYAHGESMRMVGFSCDYENQQEVIRFCRLFHAKNPKLKVVVGGPQAFALDAEFLRASGADALICGEGEITTLELYNALVEESFPLESVDGIKYLKDGNFVTNKPRALITNLDALPFPNADYILGTLFRQNIASFLTGRGCPYSCSFCYEGGNTKGVRWRSVENVIAEVEQVLSQRPDIHFVMFTDDTFTVNEARVRDFCRHLKTLRKRFDFRWFCEGHVRTLWQKDDLLKEMVEAGMICLQIGIESGDNDVLAAYNKNITTGMIEDVVKSAYSAGVWEIWGNIILGGALETRERIEKNKAFAQRLFCLAPGALNMDVVYFWPLPGTRITTSPADFGMRIVDYASLSSRLDYLVVEYPGITQKDFVNIRHEFMESFQHTVLALTSKLSYERALLILQNHNYTRNRTVWYNALTTVEEFQVFLYLLNTGAARRSTEINPDEIGDFHPMRTGHIEQFDEQHRAICLGKSLSDVETKILINASGKLSLHQLYEKMASTMAKDEVWETLVKLESKWLLVFSRF